MTAATDISAELAVVVVNFGSHDMVERNLRTSLGGAFGGRVVVVDNLSGQAERDAMSAACREHGWDLLTPSTNGGFGGGNNLGVAHAIRHGAREILLINPDATLPLEDILEMQRHVRADPMLQLSPEVVRPDGSLYAAEMDLHLATGESRSARRRAPGTPAESIHTWISGACFMVSAQLWECIGGFDDDYFLYWEDVDLSRRIVLAGGRVRADPAFRAVHDEGSTHRSGEERRVKSPTYYYYNCRNRLLYAAKMLPPTSSRRWLWTTPYASYRILLQGGRRQFARPALNVVPALRGSRDGIRYWWAHRSVRGGRGEHG